MGGSLLDKLEAACKEQEHWGPDRKSVTVSIEDLRLLIALARAPRDLGSRGRR